MIPHLSISQYAYEVKREASDPTLEKYLNIVVRKTDTF